MLADFYNKKGPVLKRKFHTNYKKYRNLLSTLIKNSKQTYYDKYFEKNWNNMERKHMERNLISYLSKI